MVEKTFIKVGNIKNTAELVKLSANIYARLWGYVQEHYKGSSINDFWLADDCVRVEVKTDTCISHLDIPLDELSESLKDMGIIDVNEDKSLTLYS